MGYYTYFDVRAEIRPDYNTLSDAEISDLLDGIVDYAAEHFDLEFTPQLDSLFNDEAKWYNVEGDIKALSCAFPEFYFTVYGAGEDREDNWILYAVNGSHEICGGEIIYDERTIW